MKPVFPTIYSTLSPAALATLVSEKYGIKNTQCKLLVRGVGDTYLVESPGHRFILRIYRSTHRGLPQVQAETTLLLALQQAHVSVSYPIADLSGQYIQQLNAAEGLRPAVLFSYAPGQPASILTDGQLISLGHEMARFHNVSASIRLNGERWNFDLSSMFFQPLITLKQAFADNPEDYAWLQQAAQKAANRLTQMDTAAFSSGYCHFDFLAKNFHFDGDKITFFDFDFLGHGWLVNDVMTFWQHLCLDVHFGRMDQATADKAYAVFIKAYRDCRPISDRELAAVPYLSLGFWLFYGAFHTTHDQFYAFVQPAHLKLRAGLIRRLMEKYWDNEMTTV